MWSATLTRLILSALVNTTMFRPKNLKRVTVWWRFWSRGIILLFFSENKHGEPVTVKGDSYWAMLNEFLFTKIEEDDIGGIWLQQDGARATQPKLYWMFCALYLKIALSAVKLMSFGQLGAKI